MSHRLHAIELSDFEIFEREIAPEVDPPSQLNFYLMYLTRSEMRMQICTSGEVKFVFGWSSENDHALYGLPLPLAASAEFLKRQLAECYHALMEEGVVRNRNEGLYLVLLNDRWASQVENIGGQIFPTTDDDNYIYSSSELGSLGGASLRRHREMVRAFEREHRDFVFAPLTTERIEDTRAIIKGWLKIKVARLKSRPPESPDYYLLLRDDFSSAMLALDNLEQFSIRGRIYYLKNEPVGFISGIPFSDDTFLYLHHKNAPIKGLAEVIYSNFTRSLVDEFEYINAAQDLGIPSLRAFKRRLSPVRMLETYRAFIPPRILLGRAST